MKIKDEVATVLSNAVSCEGHLVRITGARLDPQHYRAVNQVLEALGGKWQRGTKKVPGAHHFPVGTDAQALLDQALTLGEVTTKQELGFFETPPELARRLVEMAQSGVEGAAPDGMLLALEPSAGSGNLVRALIKAGFIVGWAEIDAGRWSDLHSPSTPGQFAYHCGDFLLITPDQGMKDVDVVCMNPPFCKVGLGDHLDHVRHAFTFLRPGGVLVSVLPVSIKWREDRRYREFRTWYQGLGGEVTDLPDGSFKAGGTMVRTCVLRVVRPEVTR